MKVNIDIVCLQNGTVLNDTYKIQNRISVSELSVVYIGYDLRRKQSCIIKEYFPNKIVLRDIDQKTVLCKMPSMKGKYYDSRELFFNEAIILKSLKHKNIAEFYDQFIDNNTGYIVMKFYDGNTLDNYIKNEKDIDISSFLKNIFIPVLNAVDAFHGKKIIHRDLKPSNIIIDNQGNPVIIDFGSAIHYIDKHKKKIFITPGFSPLEFYSERSKQGTFSDIYSLSATLYYYFCGKAPEEAGKRVIEDTIENINKFNEEISWVFAYFLMKNLSPNYKKRIRNVKLFKLLTYFEYYMIKIKNR